MQSRRKKADSDLRLQLQIVYLSTSCRNQRRQVPVKVPVKIELVQNSAITLQILVKNAVTTHLASTETWLSVPVKFKPE